LCTHLKNAKDGETNLDVIVGVDVGGTNTVIGVFDTTFSLVKKKSVSTIISREKDSRDFLEFLTLEIDRVLDSLEEKATLLCAGMGAPGIVDSTKGIAHAAVNMGWSNLDFSTEMTQRLGAPAFVDNDVRVYAFGELVAGAGKGHQNIVCVTLGTGIAACSIVDGKVVTGSKFYAGEIGHDAVPGEKFVCKCGKTGCLETIASANGIARLTTEAISNGRESLLKSIEGPIRSLDVFHAAEAGDQVALEVFSYVGKTLATKLVTVAYLLNPEVIIIGGGAAAAGEILLQPIRKVFDEQYHSSYPTPIITTGKLGDSAGLFGAAHFAYSRLKQLTNEVEKVE
jgi:glucokinase